MPKSVEKMRKKIGKKKGEMPTALHENSRDSMRLKRAAMRDDKLVRMSSSRRKNEQQPQVVRAAFFQECIRSNGSLPLDLSAIQELIATFVHQNDEEFEELKKQRRPGRPSSTREDMLRMKISTDEKEWENGFFLPDLCDADNVVLLDRWDGTWSYLPTLKWVRITKAGQTQASSFPPKGQS